MVNIVVQERARGRHYSAHVFLQQHQTPRAVWASHHRASFTGLRLPFRSHVHGHQCLSSPFVPTAGHTRSTPAYLPALLHGLVPFTATCDVLALGFPAHQRRREDMGRATDGPPHKRNEQAWRERRGEEARRRHERCPCRTANAAAPAAFQNRPRLALGFDAA